MSTCSRAPAELDETLATIPNGNVNDKGNVSVPQKIGGIAPSGRNLIRPFWRSLT